ncbi:MAG: methyltransferase domain-containing protein [Xanthomonadales bacterium]|nr:methyltransferase domain-containing protein [Xanthomonadales bacterium]
MTSWFKSHAQTSSAEEAVVWAYRLFLNREPESRDIVSRTAEGSPSWSALRATFTSSPEYSIGFGGPARPSLHGNEPAMAIEEVEEPAAIARLLDHVAAAWTHMGEEEPHFSVITDPRFKPERVSANLDEFHAGGKQNLERFTSALTRNGLSVPPGATFLELGCGVGRITRWLAGLGERIIAVDVSANHLALAREHLDRSGIGNVELVQLKRVEDITLLGEFDAFFSVIVLQHNPPPVIAALLDRILERLRPGGLAYFQVPTYRANYRFDLQAYLVENVGSTDMEMHVLPQREIMRIAGAHGCELIEVIEDTYTGMRVGEVSNTFLLRKRDAG